MANFDNIIQEINTNLPDNNTQSITAAKLRNTLIDLTNQIDTVQDDFETDLQEEFNTLQGQVETALDNLIVDDLTSTDTDKALSANQGRVLFSKIGYVKQETSIQYSFSNYGFYRPNGTIGGTTDTAYKYTNMIDVSDISEILINCGANAAISPCVFFKADNSFLSGVAAATEGFVNQSILIPSDAKYAVFSEVVQYGFSATAYKLVQLEITNDLETEDENAVPTAQTVGDAVESLYDEIQSSAYSQFYDSLPFNFTHYGFYRPNGTIGGTTGTTYMYTDMIDVSNVVSFSLYLKAGAVTVSPCVFVKNDGETIFGGITAISTGFETYNITVPTDAKYCIFSSIITGISQITCTALYNAPVSSIIAGMKEKSDFCYISLNGNDENNGSSSSNAVLTIERAKEITDKTLYILEGEYENFNFDFSSFENVIGIGNVVFMKYYQKISDATLVSGKTRVYQITTNYSLTNGFLWQHNIPDANTLISAEERHPLHRDKFYRLPSTRLYAASSIDEIENTTTKLMWYNDTTNHMLYFSKIDNSNLSNNPIIVPSYSAGYTATSEKQVNIENINIKYTWLETKNLSGNFKSCSVGMCRKGGAFVLSNTKNLILYSCEGYGTFTPSGGDGFNTHTNSLDYSHIVMFDCWGHDNCDDGESCHEHSLIVQYGGLYEYNGSGCTPASGGHGDYFNVLCRQNGNWDWVEDNTGTGFSAQGQQTIGGNTLYSTIKCWNCVAENNKIAFRNTNTNTNSNASACYNCILINNTSNFYNINHYGDTIVS